MFEADASIDRNLFWLGYPAVILHAEDGTPLNFELDTGARDTSINDNIRNKLCLGAVDTSQGLSIGSGGAEGSVRRRVTDFSFVQGLTRFHFERISIRNGTKDLAVLQPDGRLGSDVAVGGRMIIELPAGRFEVIHDR